MQETGRQVRGRGSAKTSNEFPLEIRKLPRGVAYSFICDTQFPSFEESTAALPRFLSLLAPLSLSLSRTRPRKSPPRIV